MNLKHTLITFCLLACLLIAGVGIGTATADEHVTAAEIKQAIAGIIANADLRPHEKLEAQTKAIGWNDKLEKFMSAERDQETGEPIYGEIPVITPLARTIGLEDTPYTKAEGEAAWDAYLVNYVANYQSCGNFGGPIA